MKKKDKSNKSIDQSLTTRVFVATLMGFFLSILMSTMGSIIDGIIVGHALNADQIGACSLAGPIWFIMAMVSNVLRKGAQNECTNELSRGNVEKARAIFSSSLITGMVLATVIGAGILVFRIPVAHLLGAKPGTTVHDHFLVYMTGIAFGFPGAALMDLLSCGMHLEGARKKIVLSVVVMSTSNALLDLISIYVFHGGMLAMGITTSVSYYIGALVLVFHYRKKDVLLRPSIRMPSPKVLLKICLEGMPMGFSRVTSSWKSTYINRLLAMTLTVGGLAAYNVQSQVNSIVCALFMGVAQAMAVISAIYYNERDYYGMRRVVSLSIWTEVVASVLILILLDSTSHQLILIRLFLGSNTGSYEIAIYALTFYSIGLLGQGLAVMLANYLQVIGHGLLSNLVYVLDDIVFINIGVAMLRNVAIKGEGSDVTLVASTFLGVSVGQIIMLLAIPILLFIVNRGLRFGMDGILMLPKDFKLSPDEELRSSIEKMEDAIAFSEQAYDFCLKRGVDKKKAGIVSLAAEEMAGNVIKHGFSDGKKHKLELRLVYVDDELILRSRDDCRTFDPKAYYQSVYENEDPTVNIGIRMVVNLAREVKYSSTLKLNNMMVKV